MQRLNLGLNKTRLAQFYFKPVCPLSIVHWSIELLDQVPSVFRILSFSFYDFFLK